MAQDQSSINASVGLLSNGFTLTAGDPTRKTLTIQGDFILSGNTGTSYDQQFRSGGGTIALLSDVGNNTSGSSGTSGTSGTSGKNEFTVTASTTTSITLDLTNEKQYIRFTDAAGATVTVPPQSSISWPSDVEIMVEQAGAQTIRISPGVGVTINTPYGYLSRTRTQYSVLSIKRVSSDVWTCWGDLLLQ